MTTRSPEEYRAGAQRIGDQAQQVVRDDLRETMFQIAELYERMADQVEKVVKQR